MHASFIAIETLWLTVVLGGTDICSDGFFKKFNTVITVLYINYSRYARYNKYEHLDDKK